MTFYVLFVIIRGRHQPIDAFVSANDATAAFVDLMDQNKCSMDEDVDALLSASNPELETQVKMWEFTLERRRR